MSTRTSRHRSERGASLVEAPFAVVALAAVALCLAALAQLLLDYHHLSSASRTAARYATKSDYDPARGTLDSRRRPTDAEVADHARQSARPLAAADLDVRLSVPNAVGSAGDEVTVELTYRVRSGPAAVLTESASRLLAVVGGGPLAPPVLTATTTAIYE